MVNLFFVFCFFFSFENRNKLKKSYIFSMKKNRHLKIIYLIKEHFYLFTFIPDPISIATSEILSGPRYISTAKHVINATFICFLKNSLHSVN